MNRQNITLTADTPKVVTLPEGASSVTFNLNTSLGNYIAGPATGITLPALASMTYYMTQTSGWNIAYTNGTFVAMGGSTTYYTSTNGVNWTSRTASFSGTYNLQGVNNLFFAFQSSAGAPITTFYTSPDGITWTSRTLPSTYAMQNVVYASTIGRYAAFASTSSTSYSIANVLSSTDGFTWTAYAVSSGQWTNLAASPTRFVASMGYNTAGPSVSSNTLYSTNGTTWTASTKTNSSYNSTTIYNPGDTYFYTTNGYTGGPERSTDGITWANASGNILTYMSTSNCGWAGTRAVLPTATINGTTYYYINGGSGTTSGISTDGVTWSSINNIGAYTFPLIGLNNKLLGFSNNGANANYSGFTPASFGLYAGPTNTF